MTKRKFFKTKIEIEILSEEPFEWNNLDDIKYALTEGHCSGVVKEVGHYKPLNGKQVVKELIKHGSDPECFQLNSKGNDINE
jgi:ABC-type antimicrobial peptide transport system ATPase subunit